jgi:hypothetical protein
MEFADRSFTELRCTIPINSLLSQPAIRLISQVCFSMILVSCPEIASIFVVIKDWAEGVYLHAKFLNTGHRFSCYG